MKLVLQMSNTKSRYQKPNTSWYFPLLQSRVALIDSRDSGLFFSLFSAK